MYMYVLSISLSIDASSLREELAITNLDPKEAHAKFVERVKDNKQATENMSNKIEATQNEVDRLRYSSYVLTNVYLRCECIY